MTDLKVCGGALVVPVVSFFYAWIDISDLIWAYNTLSTLCQEECPWHRFGRNDGADKCV